MKYRTNVIWQWQKAALPGPAEKGTVGAGSAQANAPTSLHFFLLAPEHGGVFSQEKGLCWKDMTQRWKTVMELPVSTLPPSLAGPELCNKVVGIYGFTLLLICYYYSKETINFNFPPPPPQEASEGKSRF